MNSFQSNQETTCLKIPISLGAAANVALIVKYVN